MEFRCREAKIEDIAYITEIYNQGIEDRIATLETRLRGDGEMQEWFSSRGERYKVIVIEDIQNKVSGCTSINAFNSRCCYNGVGDLSIYVERSMRGKGLSRILLGSLFDTARKQGFNKLVLSTLNLMKREKDCISLLDLERLEPISIKGFLMISL